MKETFDPDGNNTYLHKHHLLPRYSFVWVVSIFVGLHNTTSCILSSAVLTPPRADFSCTRGLRAKTRIAQRVREYQRLCHDCYCSKVSSTLPGWRRVRAQSQMNTQV